MTFANTLKNAGRWMAAGSIGLSALAAVAGPAAASHGPGPRAADGEPIVLGQLRVSTGSLSTLGGQITGGLEMAIEDVNANGGIAGRPIELVSEEAGESPETAIAALQKLLTRDIDGIVGAAFTGYVIPMAPIIDNAGIPTIHAAQGPAITADGDGSEWMFRIVSDDSVAARALVPTAMEETGATKVAILHSSGDYGINFRDGVESVLAEEYPDVEIVTQQHDDGDTDFTPQLRAIEESGAEVVFSGQYPADVAKIANQRREAGLELPFFWNNAADTALGFDLIEQDVLLGDYVPNDIVPRWSDDPVVVDWVAEYESRYDRDPASVGASWYSGLLMLADAMERAGDPGDRDAVREALAATESFESFHDLPTMGFVYSCDEQNNCHSRSQLYQITADGPVLVTTFEAAAG